MIFDTHGYQLCKPMKTIDGDFLINLKGIVRKESDQMARCMKDKFFPDADEDEDQLTWQ